MELHGEFDRSFQQLGRKMSDNQLLFLALLWGLQVLDTTNNKSGPSYRLHNVHAGYVLYRALVLSFSSLKSAA